MSPTTPRTRCFAAAPVLTAAVLLCAPTLHAQSTATQTVSLSVPAINQISVSGNPGTLTVSQPAAGSAPAAVSDASTTYAITSNENNKKITAQLSAGPTYGSLAIALQVPGGTATSTGTSTFSGTTALDVINSLANIAVSGKTVTYTYTPSLTGGAFTQSITVTLSVVAGP